MNSTQTVGTIDRVLIVMATWLLGFMEKKGWITSGDTAMFLPIIVAVPAALWGWHKNKSSKLIANVDALPGVAGVVTQNTIEGKELAESVPSMTVAPAGSTQAEKVAA